MSYNPSVLKSSKVAFVSGCTGITGYAITEHLIRKPKDEWSKIVISSRKRPTVYWSDPRVEWVSIDFLKPVEEIVDALNPFCKDVTHAFFSSYIHAEDLSKLPEKNVPLFKNFVDAIEIVSPKLQRISLQTGGKYYGLFPRAIPLTEDMPRYDDKGTNFYYPQEDYLAEAQKRSDGRWFYNVFRPNAVIGFTPQANGMSVGLSMAIYLLVHAELGQVPLFPGSEHALNSPEDVSYPPGMADMTLWATTQENTKNEAFNCCIGDPFIWRFMFPKLAKHFGVEVSEDQVQVLPGSSQEWAKDKREAWISLTSKYGGDPTAFDWCTWDMFTWCMDRKYTPWSSINKAKRLGWTRQDFAFDVWVEAFRSFENAGVLPKASSVRARLEG
ncbi:Nucleoside-diphosphate-sugar epimerase [Neofusicoccum parvum]|nr:Nucleoside-diphosphate-sugar epimerase [Neofusicoccum parvum]